MPRPCQRPQRIKPMKAPIVRLPLLLLFAFTGGLPAWGSADLSPPQQVVERVSERLMRVLREDRELLERDPTSVYRLVDELLLPNVAVDRASVLALGPVSRQTTPAQREAFAEEFKKMLIRTYATAVDELSEWEIRYLPIDLTPEQRETTVRTRILRPGGKPIAVDYRMLRRDGRWLAYDVSIEGVSLLINYRSTFVRLAREKGIDGLIQHLAEHNANH